MWVARDGEFLHGTAFTTSPTKAIGSTPFQGAGRAMDNLPWGVAYGSTILKSNGFGPMQTSTLGYMQNLSQWIWDYSDYSGRRMFWNPATGKYQN